jgi:multiple sugar transport system permease protein
MAAAAASRSLAARPRRRPLPSAGRLLLYLVLLALSALFLAPLAWMLSTSLKPDAQVFADHIQWVPSPVAWDNYRRALAAFPFLLYLRNTLTITLLGMAGQLLTGPLVAYSFARLRWPLRDFWFIVLLATIMLPSFVTLVPRFILFHLLGWINTFAPLVVTSYFGGTPFSIFLLRQYFLTLPQELSDAARIDGAGEFTLYWRVILPLAGPALAAVAIFAFTDHWNDFIGPLVYLNPQQLWTLSLGLLSFQTDIGTALNLLMAASLVVVLPVVVLFFVAQRWFISGIALTGLKG